jgi:hypothetical protein
MLDSDPSITKVVIALLYSTIDVHGRIQYIDLDRVSAIRPLLLEEYRVITWQEVREILEIILAPDKEALQQLLQQQTSKSSELPPPADVETSSR